MDKTAIDPPNEKGRTSKPSVASNAVLNMLKRFRKRRKDTTDSEPPFNDRLGASSEPLAERNSEISNLIETSISQGAEPSGPATTGEKPNAADAPEEGAPASGEAGETNAADRADARRKPRARSMGFHEPVFPAKAPDTPKDPDFAASTEPPVLKLHDAPDGVMENPGAPEKLVTPPKQKRAEPFDLEVFAEQVRANAPKPETKTPAIEDGGETAETDAAAPKENFYARVSKASNASVFEGFSGYKPKIFYMPASITNLGAHNVTASAALQSWRKFQSPGDGNMDAEGSDHLDEPVRPAEAEAPQGIAEPAAAEEPDSNNNPAPDAEGYSAGPDLSRFEYASFEPQLDDMEIELEQGDVSEKLQENGPESAAEQEPEAVKAAEPESETPSDPEPATSETASETERDHEDAPEETLQIAPEDLFGALNISEEELLTKVYDAIQEELRAAWGENITLNIRRIVREEVRAAVEKARSGI